MRGGAEIRSEARLRGSRTTVFLGAGLRTETRHRGRTSSLPPDGRWGLRIRNSELVRNPRRIGGFGPNLPRTRSSSGVPDLDPGAPGLEVELGEGAQGRTREGERLHARAVAVEDEHEATPVVGTRVDGDRQRILDAARLGRIAAVSLGQAAQQPAPAIEEEDAASG